MVGAGFSGLAAARVFLDAGVEFRLFEAESGPGGLLRTDIAGAFSFDRAGHFLHFQTETFEQILKHLHVPMTVVSRRSAILIGRRIVPYPLQFNLHAAPAELRDAALADLAAGRIGRVGADDYATLLLKAWGPALYEAFFRPYNEKLWARPLCDLPSDCGARFLPQPNKDLLLKGAAGPIGQYGYNAEFAYPSSGRVGDLAFAMASPLEHAIEYEARINSIDLTRQRIRFGQEWVDYKKLIFTGPLSQVCELTGLSGPPLVYSRVLNLRIGFRGRMRINDHWLYVPDEAVSFFRVGFPSNVDSRTCPPGCASMSLEYGLDETQDTPDIDRSVATAVGYFADLGIIDCEAVEEISVHLISPAYVADRNVGQRGFAPIIGQLAQANIMMAGRFGSWDYFSAEDAYFDGARAANAALAGVIS